jgi:hypothetical protein
MALMAAFIPGASPPLVTIAILFKAEASSFLIVLNIYFGM